ncbi:MAG: hydrolase Nlp/P60 [Paenibacillaceae bacterium]|nr:hydrolase Nlp/P60 [Paenibacillaceae bacterium]
MTKRLMTLLLAALIVLAAVPPAALAGESVSTKAKIAAGVSFRDEPSTSGNLIRYLKTNETVTLLQQVNPYWYKVGDQNGTTGYVSSNEKYIEFSSNAQILYGVNFRTSPGTTGAVIRMLGKGEEILILEKINDGWYKARDSKGVTGYVSTGAKYIEVNTDVYKMALSREDRIESFISEGMKYLGTPYEFGSQRFDISTFDCSDFVQQAFWNMTGIALPGDSRGQADYVRNRGPVQLDWTRLKRGDLMFFMSYEGSKASDYAHVNRMTERVTHVAIYLGGGQMLHTYSPESGGVRIDTLSGKAWEHRYLYGGSFTD